MCFLVDRLALWFGRTERHRERRRRRLALRRLNDAELRDIGLARSPLDGRIRPLD